MSELAAAKKFQFVGGDLSVDFCNTLGGKRGATTTEHLGSFLNYVGWCHQAGLLDQSQAQSCLREAARRPDEAAATLARGVELREGLFRIFAALISGGAPSRSDMELLNGELSRALNRLRLAPGKDESGFSWEWRSEKGQLDQPLGPIAHAAANLLTERTRLDRLRICHGDNCGWLFLDASKNHSRCWCDMRDCGNRAKMRRHRLKQSGG
jgi:predicted RNA-binding Zn ribbon-like protein